MIRHRFREEKGSLGKVLRPIAEVILEKDGFRVGMPITEYQKVKNKNSVGISGRSPDINGQNGYI
jgi:hypothetical protein